MDSSIHLVKDSDVELKVDGTTNSAEYGSDRMEISNLTEPKSIK